MEINRARSSKSLAGKNSLGCCICVDKRSSVTRDFCHDTRTHPQLIERLSGSARASGDCDGTVSYSLFKDAREPKDNCSIAGL